MIVAQDLSANDAMHVGLHKLLNEVDLFEFIERRRAEDVKDGNDVLVTEVSEELDLA